MLFLFASIEKRS